MDKVESPLPKERVTTFNNVPDGRPASGVQSYGVVGEDLAGTA